MSDPSASIELEPADSQSPLFPEAKRSRDGRGQAIALIVGAFIGMGIGLGIGMGIGNATRKRIDRFSPRY